MGEGMLRIIGFAVISCMLVLCNENPEETEDCSTLSDPEMGLELIYPKSGNFTMGNTVPVKWKVNPKKMQKVDIQVSASGIEGPYRNILSKSIAITDGDETICMDTLWTIGNEFSTVDYNAASGTTVYVRVVKYSEEDIKSVSNPISINRP
jgi:hypothetical protein